MSDRSIEEAIKKLAGTHLKDEIHMCDATVKYVDQMSRTCVCTPIGGKAVTDLGNVLLMSEVDDGFLKIPAIGSTVRVQWSTRVVPFITMYSQLQKVILVTIDGIQFQGGELGGLVKVIDLTTKLNNLENAYNDLVTKFNSHTHVLALSSGTGTAAPTTTAETTILSPTNQTEIENTAIKHGV